MFNDHQINDYKTEFLSFTNKAGCWNDNYTHRINSNFTLAANRLREATSSFRLPCGKQRCHAGHCKQTFSLSSRDWQKMKSVCLKHRVETRQMCVNTCAVCASACVSVHPKLLARKTYSTSKATEPRTLPRVLHIETSMYLQNRNIRENISEPGREIYFYYLCHTCST